MFTKKKDQKGFTLIELMIVVVIIGILAALAIPRFMRSATKSKQSEAKGILKQVYTLQQAYRQEKDLYWPTAAVAGSATPNAFGDIGVEVGPTARYSYSFSLSNATAFTCQAFALGKDLDDDQVIDNWQIDQNGSLVCVCDDATLP